MAQCWDTWHGTWKKEGWLCTNCALDGKAMKENTEEAPFRFMGMRTGELGRQEVEGEGSLGNTLPVCQELCFPIHSVGRCYLTLSNHIEMQEPPSEITDEEVIGKMGRSSEHYESSASQNPNTSKAKINRLFFFLAFYFCERDKCQRSKAYISQIIYKISPGSPHVSRGSAQSPVCSQLESYIMRSTHNEVTRP